MGAPTPTNPQVTTQVQPASTASLPEAGRSGETTQQNAALTLEQQKAVKQLIEQETERLGKERGALLGALVRDEAGLKLVDAKIKAVEARLQAQFPDRPELVQHFNLILTKKQDWYVVEQASAVAWQLGKEIRDAKGLDGTGDSRKAEERFAQYQGSLSEVSARNPAVEKFLNERRQDAERYTDDVYTRAEKAAAEMFHAIDGIGFDSTRFRNAATSLTQREMQLAHIYYKRISKGDDLRAAVDSQWLRSDSDVALVSVASKRRDHYSEGGVMVCDSDVDQIIKREDLSKVTDLILSAKQEGVQAVQLYISLTGEDALKTARTVFEGVPSQEREKIEAAFHKNFNQTYRQMAAEWLSIEERIAVTNLAQSGRVEEKEVLRVMNQRAVAAGEELGRARAAEFNSEQRVGELERRFERTVVAHVSEHAEQASLLRQIKERSSLVAQQEKIREVVFDLEKNATRWAHIQEDACHDAEASKRQGERLHDYMAKHRGFLEANPEFAAALKSEQQRISTSTEKSQAKLNRAMVAIKKATDGHFLGTGWGTDEEAVYEALKGLDKEERSFLAKMYRSRYGKNLQSVIDEEFSGAEHDKATGLLEGKLAQVAAADVYLNISSTWENFFGRDTKKIEGFIKEVPAEQRQEIKDYFDKNYAAQVTWSEVDTSAPSYTYSEAGPPQKIVHGTSLDHILLSLYSQDERDSVFALVANDNQGYRAAKIHHLVTDFELFYGDDKEINKVLEEFYDPTAFNEKGELTLERKAEIDSFVKHYNEKYRSDLRVALEKELSSPGNDWAKALLDGDRVGAGAGKLRFAMWYNTSTDSRLIGETFDVDPAFQSLPDESTQKQQAVALQKELNAQIEARYNQQYSGRKLDDDLKSWSSYSMGSTVWKYTGGGLWNLTAGNINNEWGISYDDSLYVVYSRRKERGTATTAERVIEETNFSGLLSGVDGEKIKSLTEGKTKEETAKIKADAADILKAAGSRFQNLEPLLDSVLSSDVQFDVRDNLRGLPTTANEMLERARERYAYERSGLFSFTVGNFDNSRSHLDRRLERLEEFVEELRKAGKADTELKQLSKEQSTKLRALNSQFLGAAEVFRSSKNELAEMATMATVIAVSVAISVASFGTLSGVSILLVVSASSLATTWAMKFAIRGNGFELMSREAGTDFVFSVVDGALSVVGGKVMQPLADKFAKAFARQFADSAVHGAFRRIGLLKGFSVESVERALAAEGLAGGLEQATAKAGKAAAAAGRMEAASIRAANRSLLVEHTRSIGMEAFTTVASSGVQTAAGGEYTSLSDFVQSWGSAVDQRMRMGLYFLPNIVSTRVQYHGEQRVAARFIRAGDAEFTSLAPADRAKLSHSELFKSRQVGGDKYQEATKFVDDVFSKTKAQETAEQGDSKKEGESEPLKRGADSEDSSRPNTNEDLDPHTRFLGHSEPGMEMHGRRAAPPLSTDQILDRGHHEVAEFGAKLLGEVKTPVDSGTPTSKLDPWLDRKRAILQAKNETGIADGDPALFVRERFVERRTAVLEEIIKTAPERTDSVIAAFSVLEANLPLTAKGATAVDVNSAALLRLGIDAESEVLQSRTTLRKYVADFIEAHPETDPASISTASRQLMESLPAETTLEARQVLRLERDEIPDTHQGVDAVVSSRVAAESDPVKAAVYRSAGELLKSTVVPYSTDEACLVLGIDTNHPALKSRGALSALIELQISSSIGHNRQAIKRAGGQLLLSLPPDRDVASAMAVLKIRDKEELPQTIAELEAHRDALKSRAGHRQHQYIDRAAEVLRDTILPHNVPEALRVVGLDPNAPESLAALSNRETLRAHMATQWAKANAEAEPQNAFPGRTSRAPEAFLHKLAIAERILSRCLPPESLNEARVLLADGVLGRRGEDARFVTGKELRSAVDEGIKSSQRDCPEALRKHIQRSFFKAEQLLADALIPIGRKDALRVLGLKEDSPALRSSSSIREVADRLVLQAGAEQHAQIYKARDLLLRRAAPDTVGDCWSLIAGESSSNFPKTKAEFLAAAEAALSGKKLDATDRRNLAIAIQRMQFLFPPADFSAAASAVAGKSWADHPGFASLLRTQEAVAAWGVKMKEGAPRVYRDSIDLYVAQINRVALPDSVGGGRERLGFGPKDPLPKTRAELFAHVEALLAKSPVEEHAAIVRSFELVVSRSPKGAMEALYVLELVNGPDVTTARADISQPPHLASSEAKAKYDALKTTLTAKPGEALDRYRAGGVLKDRRTLIAHAEARKAVSPENTHRAIDQAAKTLQEHVINSRFHEALSEFGLTPTSPELKSQGRLRAHVAKREETAARLADPVQERTRLANVATLKSVLELHLPPSRTTRVLSWLGRRVGIMTTDSALSQLHIARGAAASPEAMTVDGVRSAFNERRQSIRQLASEAPDKTQRKVWARELARVERAYQVIMRRLPLGAADPEISAASQTLGMSTAGKFSDRNIDAAAKAQIKQAGGDVSKINEIRAAQLLLKSALVELPPRKWWDPRWATLDVVVSRKTRAFEAPRSEALRSRTELVSKLRQDYADALNELGVTDTRKRLTLADIQTWQKAEEAKLVGLNDPKQEARVKAIAEIGREIIERHGLTNRLRGITKNEVLALCDQPLTGPRDGRTLADTLSPKAARVEEERTLDVRVERLSEVVKQRKAAQDLLGLSTSDPLTRKTIDTARSKTLESATVDRRNAQALEALGVISEEGVSKKPITATTLREAYLAKYSEIETLIASTKDVEQVRIYRQQIEELNASLVTACALNHLPASDARIAAALNALRLDKATKISQADITRVVSEQLAVKNTAARVAEIADAGDFLRSLFPAEIIAEASGTIRSTTVEAASMSLRLGTVDLFTARLDAAAKVRTKEQFVSKLVDIETKADLLVISTGERPWSVKIDSKDRSGNGASGHVDSIKSSYEELYRARELIDLPVGSAQKPFFAATEITAAANRKLAEVNSRVSKGGADGTTSTAAQILAARDYLLAAQRAQTNGTRQPIIGDLKQSLRQRWGFGEQPRESQLKLPTLAQFEEYHSSRITSLSEIGVKGYREDGAPRYAEGELLTLKRRQLSKATDDVARARIEAAYEFLVADLKSGGVDIKYNSRFRVVADLVATPLLLPVRNVVGVGFAATTKVLRGAFRFVDTFVPGRLTFEALGSMQRFVVNFSETVIYPRLPEPLQALTNATFGNLRRAWWATTETVGTLPRRVRVHVEEPINSLLGRQRIWSGDPSIQSFEARLLVHQERLEGVARARKFVGLPETGDISELTSLGALEKHLKKKLAAAKSVEEQQLITLARDALVRDIIHRDTGVLLSRDAANVVSRSVKAGVGDFVIKAALLNGALSLLALYLENRDRLAAFMEPSPDGYPDEEMFGVTREMAEANPFLEPFVLTDRDPYYAMFTPEQLASFGGEPLSPRFRNRIEMAHRKIAHPAKPRAYDPPPQAPTLFNATGNKNLPEDVKAWSAGRAFMLGFPGIEGDEMAEGRRPLSSRFVTRSQIEEELRTAVLPVRRANGERVQTGSGKPGFRPPASQELSYLPGAEFSHKSPGLGNLDLPRRTEWATKWATDLLGSVGKPDVFAKAKKINEAQEPQLSFDPSKLPANATKVASELIEQYGGGSFRIPLVVADPNSAPKGKKN